MSSLFVELWLTRLLDEAQIGQIDTLVRQIGEEIVASQSTWHEYKQSLTIQERPIDRMLQLNLSARLRSTLIELDQMQGRGDDDVARVHWGFRFADSSALAGAPSADNYNRDGEYPHFGIFIQHEPFQLLTGSGYGTNQYNLQQWLVGYAKEFERIVTQLGSFPAAQGFIYSRFPFDCLLAGHLAIRLLEIFDGCLVVSTNDMLTEPALDNLLNEVRQGVFPGMIYRLTDHIQTPSGLREFVKHIVDVHFLREWIKHPSFNLF